MIVDDTRLGLGRLAAHWRRKFKLPLIAVTGSNGKTSTKDLIAHLLARLGRVPKTADHFEWGGMKFEVIDMDGRRIDKVLVTKLPR